MKSYTYQAILKAEGRYIEVSFPDIDGCVTFGETFDDAVRMGTDALATMLSYLLETGKPLPQPVYTHDALNGASVFFSVTAPTEEPKTITVSGAAAMLGVSPRRINAMIKEGTLSAVKAGRDNLVTIASVEARINTPRKAGRPRKQPAFA